MKFSQKTPRKQTDLSGRQKISLFTKAYFTKLQKHILGVGVQQELKGATSWRKFMKASAEHIKGTKQLRGRQNYKDIIGQPWRRTPKT